jgi:hypothetical protein
MRKRGNTKFSICSILLEIKVENFLNNFKKNYNLKHNLIVSQSFKCENVEDNNFNSNSTSL